MPVTAQGVTVSHENVTPQSFWHQPAEGALDQELGNAGSSLSASFLGSDSTFWARFLPGKGRGQMTPSQSPIEWRLFWFLGRRYDPSNLRANQDSCCQSLNSFSALYCFLLSPFSYLSYSVLFHSFRGIESGTERKRKGGRDRGRWVPFLSSSARGRGAKLIPILETFGFTGGLEIRKGRLRLFLVISTTTINQSDREQQMGIYFKKAFLSIANTLEILFFVWAP